MAKKSQKTEPHRPGALYGVRCTDQDSAEFERAADAEGFSSVQQWLLALGRKRARAILSASEKGNVRISETLIVPDQPGE